MLNPLSLRTYILVLCIHMKWAAPLRLIFMLHKNKIFFSPVVTVPTLFVRLECKANFLFLSATHSYFGSGAFFRHLKFVFFSLCHFACNKTARTLNALNSIRWLFQSFSLFWKSISPFYYAQAHTRHQQKSTCECSRSFHHFFLAHIFFPYFFLFGALPPRSVIIRLVKVCFFMKSVKMKNVTNRIWITRRSGREREREKKQLRESASQANQCQIHNFRCDGNYKKFTVSFATLMWDSSVFHLVIFDCGCHARFIFV